MNRLAAVAAAALALYAQGCATAASNYTVKYSMSGAANETLERNEGAERAFGAEASPEVTSQRSRIKVFIDSVPPELTLKDDVLSVSAGQSAMLLGSVELRAHWSAPDDAEVIPAIQRAADSAEADLAFCPRAESKGGYRWRCYLVRTGPGVARSSASTTL